MDFAPVLTAAEMRAADAAAAGELGVPTLLLMENAGRGLADVVCRERGASSGPIIFVCGPGSNGGDGFVAARHLAVAGVPVRVLLAAPPAQARGDAAVALAAAQRLQIAIEDGSGWTDPAVWRARLDGAAVVVDALFGTGFHGPVRGAAAPALQAMNEVQARKVAVDIPTGLDADTGRADGLVFRADVTATMGAWKLGLAVDAAGPAGRVEVVDLGVPVARGEGAARAFLVDGAGVAARVPRRTADAHKGSSGHLLVVAGSAGKTGAALLVARAALRAGAGLVTVASTPAGQTALDAKTLEVMTARYGDGDEPAAAQATPAIEALAARKQALAIGPGIPTGEGMRAVVRELAARLPLPMVIDADGLNALGTDAAGVLANAPAPRVLTPHPGEMGRLIGKSIAEVQSDRIGVARGLAAAARAIVVLKGARTVIAAPDGRVFINPIACAALATAGSGDVLCGLLSALLTRRLDPLTAAQVAVYVHGRAGEDLAGRFGDGTTAGDLPDAIAAVMTRLARA
ncbi:MAG TPA: NAD(P)H-hydrate dehydratase [Polyangia bacterium]|nr:NAD(P)H-hydrate dehydratase [Polyangia bacterium]